MLIPGDIYDRTSVGYTEGEVHTCLCACYQLSSGDRVAVGEYWVYFRASPNDPAVSVGRACSLCRGKTSRRPSFSFSHRTPKPHLYKNLVWVWNFFFWESQLLSIPPRSQAVSLGKRLRRGQGLRLRTSLYSSSEVQASPWPGEF